MQHTYMVVMGVAVVAMWVPGIYIVTPHNNIIVHLVLRASSIVFSACEHDTLTTHAYLHRKTQHTQDINFGLLHVHMESILHCLQVADQMQHT